MQGASAIYACVSCGWLQCLLACPTCSGACSPVLLQLCKSCVPMPSADSQGVQADLARLRPPAAAAQGHPAAAAHGDDLQVWAGGCLHPPAEDAALPGRVCGLHQQNVQRAADDQPLRAPARLPLSAGGLHEPWRAGARAGQCWGGSSGGAVQALAVLWECTC